MSTPDPSKRHLLTEPHDGHPGTETCPACPHTPDPEAPKLDPFPWHDEWGQHSKQRRGRLFLPHPNYSQNRKDYPNA